MNALVVACIGVFAVLWVLSLWLPNTHRFAFALWFPFTATSVIGTLLWLSAIPAMCSRGGAAADGFAALGAFLVVLWLLPCLLILAISYRRRPFRAACTPRIVVPSILLYLGTLGSLVAAFYHVGKNTLRITVLDSNRLPVPHASIAYETYPRGSGFTGARLEGEAMTDSEGKASLPTRTAHQLSGFITKDGFGRLSFRMDRPWGTFAFRQTSISWTTNDDARGGSAMVDVVDAKQMDLTIFLPHAGGEANLPYPPYQPAQSPESDTVGKTRSL